MRFGFIIWINKWGTQAIFRRATPLDQTRVELRYSCNIFPRNFVERFRA